MSSSPVHAEPVNTRSGELSFHLPVSCSNAEPDALFVRGAARQAAKKICVRCPMVTECLADSPDNRTEFGVWRGMTERQRRAVLKRRLEVLSWRVLFEADRMVCSSTRPEAVALTGVGRARTELSVSVLGRCIGGRHARRPPRADPPGRG